VPGTFGTRPGVPKRLPLSDSPFLTPLVHATFASEVTVAQAREVFETYEIAEALAQPR